MATRTKAPTNPSPVGTKDHGGQLKRLRRWCLSMPGAVEKISHGEPTFFTPRRVFAMFANNHHGDGHIAAWLPAGEGVQGALIEEAPEIYFKPPYVGPSGWIGVELSRVDDGQLGALVSEAFLLMTAKDRKPATAARSRIRKPRVKR
jgi:hypothetical protein